jgi:hypothetical protein
MFSQSPGCVANVIRNNIGIVRLAFFQANSLSVLFMVLSDKLEHPSKAHQVNHHAAQKLNHSMRAALRFCL